MKWLDLPGVRPVWDFFWRILVRLSPALACKLKYKIINKGG